MPFLTLDVVRILLRRWACALAAIAALGCGPAAEAEPKVGQSGGAAVDDQNDGEADDSKIGEKWVRVVRDGGDPIAMQTAIVRFVPAADYDDGKQPGEYARYVDLVGAVHIGDVGYYRQLNRRFRNYDAVLYELVAPEGTVVPRGRGTSSSHPLGALQNAMKSMLEVEHQLEQIDYTRPNFVHADLSPDEFFESMEKRDESFMEMYFRIVGASLAQQSQQSVAGAEMPSFFSLLMADDRARQFKLILAQQFEGMESLMLALSGPDGSTLITERNKRALDVLEKQLDAGENRLAIFYGAGHLVEMKDELEKRFNMRPVSIEWLEAWNLRDER